MVGLINTACAQGWVVDPNKSTVTFDGDHAGTPFSGQFSSFTSVIHFDPNKLDKAKATLTFSMEDVAVSNTYYAKTLQTKDWFHTQAYKKATFTTTSIQASEQPHQYTVAGLLKIKNITRRITFPATVTMQGEDAVVDASFQIERLRFDIGSQSDPDGSWVTTSIPVQVHLEASRKEVK